VIIPCRCQTEHEGACPVRFSRLKLIARSPLHYAAATVEETMAMETGSAVHSIVLGGAPIHAWEEGRPRRGKEYEAFVADLPPGAIVLTAKAFAEAHAIAEAVKANRIAMAALDGDRELELRWRFGNRWCAGRMDAVPLDGVTELKVSRTSNPADFVWHALRQGWLAQDVWYLDALAASGRMLEHARIVAVEPKPPYAVTTFKLSARTIDQARKTYRLWFERLRVCEDAGEFPPYAQSEVELDVPDNDVALDFGDVEAA